MRIVKLILKIILCLILIIGIFFTAVYANYEYIMKEEIVTIHSPDGRYSFVFYQIGSLEWPFGSVTTQICVKNEKGRIIDKNTFELVNDGASANEYNIEDIRWYENTVEIDIKGADEIEYTTYTLKLQ